MYLQYGKNMYIMHIKNPNFKTHARQMMRACLYIFHVIIIHELRLVFLHYIHLFHVLFILLYIQGMRRPLEARGSKRKQKIVVLSTFRGILHGRVSNFWTFSRRNQNTIMAHNQSHGHVLGCVQFIEQILQVLTTKKPHHHRNGHVLGHVAHTDTHMA